MVSSGGYTRKEQIMVVNIKLEFADGQELRRMRFLLLKLQCPYTEYAQCKKCHYYESCLKLRDIINTLGDVVINEE